MHVAVIGTGISGLASAWLLRRRHQVTVYEAAPSIGGHTNTIPVSRHGRTWYVDTGFIVFNELNYPLFNRLLAELQVASQPSTMSFSLSDRHSGLEYNGSSLNGLFAQRRNLLRPRFLGMLRDILRFNRAATALATGERVDGADDEGIGDFCQRLGLGEAFRSWYLRPIASAIWSTPPGDIDRFPARTMAAFLHHHRMLQLGGRPAWRTVVGGSCRYVQALTADFRDDIRVAAPVRRVERLAEGGVAVQTENDRSTYDAVVIASHSDQALAMLAAPSTSEHAVLGAIRYAPNQATLHTDESIMPRRRRAWAAWNAHIGLDEGNACLTYHMNALQRLGASEQFFVSLGEVPVDESRVLRRIQYQHPQFDAAAVAAQRRVGEVSGVDRIHYAGAYWGWGFHEDGMRSAVRVAKELGVDW